MPPQQQGYGQQPPPQHGGYGGQAPQQPGHQPPPQGQKLPSRPPPPGANQPPITYSNAPQAVRDVLMYICIQCTFALHQRTIDVHQSELYLH